MFNEDDDALARCGGDQPLAGRILPIDARAVTRAVLRRRPSLRGSGGASRPSGGLL